jgi:Putative auto-transporter adhesin, head GIN domain
MSVAVTVPVLRSATLSGAGGLAVTDLAADTFTARLPGAGTLTASGRADRVDVPVAGAGTAVLTSLLGTDATATVAGTGSVLLAVTGSLHGTVSGTGSIVYTGHPDQVTRIVTGEGSITGG